MTRNTMPKRLREAKCRWRKELEKRYKHSDLRRLHFHEMCGEEGSALRQACINYYVLHTYFKQPWISQ